MHEVAPARTPPRPLAPASQPAASQAAAAPAARSAASAAASHSAISSSWSAALSAWLDAHKFYPELAQQRGEQGTVLLRFTVTRDGQVLTVSVIQGSGSEILDRAAVKLLSGAHLPPFPHDMPGPEATVTVPIRYLLQ